MLPLPGKPGVVTECPSFTVAHFSFGCTKQREMLRDLFPHETLPTSSKSRIAAHTSNYTLRHKMRYSGKKFSPFFLSNSSMRIKTHGEIDYIHLSYTYTGFLFYLKKRLLSSLTIVIPTLVWEVAGGATLTL